MKKITLFAIICLTMFTKVVGDTHSFGTPLDEDINVCAVDLEVDVLNCKTIGTNEQDVANTATSFGALLLMTSATTEGNLHADYFDNLPRIFKDTKFGGRSSTFDTSISSFYYFDGNWNGHISSVYVPNNYKLVFYKHVDFCGNSLSLGPGWHDLYDRGWNDHPSSVKVYYKGKLQGYANSCSSSSSKGNCPQCGGDGWTHESHDFGPLECTKCGGDGDF